MLETEVTGNQAAALGLTGQSGDKPRNEVNWHDARAVCLKAGGDLPTEFQWEQAARGGGSEGSWGLGANGTLITPDNLHHYANYYKPELDNHDLPSLSHISDDLLPAKQLKSNAFGLYDLWGNVSEWTLDGYDSDAYAKWGNQSTKSNEDYPLLVNPGFVETIGARTPSRRVHRGGSLKWGRERTVSGLRFSAEPSEAVWYVGFRCVSRALPSPVHF